MERNREYYNALNRVITIFIVLTLSIPKHGNAETPMMDPFPSLRHGVGARAIAMGGTGVVNSAGAEAILWNPSQIITDDRISLVFFGNMNSNTELSGIPSSNYFFSGFTVRMKDSEWLFFERPTLGAAIFYYNMSGLSVIGVNPSTAAPIPTGYNNESSSDLLLVIPFATDMIYSERRLSIGINLMVHNHSLFSVKSNNATGIDMGAKWVVFGETNPAGRDKQTEYASDLFLILGARIRHIHKIKWESEYSPESYSQNDWRYFDLGMSFGSRVFDSSWFKGITVSQQFRIDENKDYHYSLGSEIALNSVRLRVGAENLLSSYNSEFNANSSLNFGLGLLRLTPSKAVNGIHFDIYYKMYMTGDNVWMENETGVSLGYYY